MKNDGVKSFSITDLVSDWAGYVSSLDKTTVAWNVLVQGSQNVYKTLKGTIAVREGQKRIGAADTTLSPISSKFVWNTSWGATYTLAISNSNLYLILDDVWYSLQSGLTLTRYVFDKWWDNVQKKDLSVFCNGTDSLFSWAGGFATKSASTASTITKTGSSSWFQSGFTKITFATIGSATSQFDITNPAGTTFRYTWDTTGTDPAITASSVPVGSYILIGAQNFTAANNGLFVVTGSGANYFEVTNAAGVAENNKTIGTGYIYKNYTKVIKIGSTVYAYTGGEDTTILTGVTPDATSLSSSTVTSAVITHPDTPADGFLADFLKVINNQLYVGSRTSRLIYISDDSDYTNFVVPTPRTPGDPELLTLDGVGKGIGVRQGKAHIGFGSSNWAVISFTDITVGSTLTQKTTVDVKPVAIGQAPYAHEFIDTVGDSLIYLAQDQQVRSFGDFNNLFTPGFPSLSQAVALELSAEDFTSGSLSCIGEFVYLCSPVSGKTYIYQVRYGVDKSGQVIAERLWFSPFTWNLTGVDEIDGVTVGFSNANPQIYQLWDTEQWHDDSPSDEAIPYRCVATLGYRSLQTDTSERYLLQEFDKFLTEGYISGGTNLNLTLNYDYDGSSGIKNAIINSDAQPARIFSADSPSSLGDSSLGDESLGESADLDSDALSKFRCINSMPQINCFEYQPVISSEQAGARWELLALGSNTQQARIQNPTFIINKAPIT